MPAGGSAISGTVAHKHQAASATGGPLDANSITEFSSTSTGSLIYFDASSQATNLNAGGVGTVLTMGASVPSWASAGGGTWDVLVSERDNVIANTLDTGYIDFGSYRVLKYYWSAYLDSGSAGLQVRFYNPDGNIETSSIQATAGFYNSNTLNQNANQSSYLLTFGGNLMTSRDIVLEMTVLCASVKNDGGGGRYSLSQRGNPAASYNGTYCNGNLFQAWNSSLVSGDLMYFNGIKDISGNTWTDGILTVLGTGDNTT